jgi:hypothetical protein
MADAKSTISTTLFDSSGPDYQQSSTGSGTTPLDHLSFTNSQNKQSRLRISRRNDQIEATFVLSAYSRSEKSGEAL